MYNECLLLLLVLDFCGNTIATFALIYDINVTVTDLVLLIADFQSQIRDSLNMRGTPVPLEDQAKSPVPTVT
jgi:hypothetical protein